MFYNQFQKNMIKFEGKLSRFYSLRRQNLYIATRYPYSIQHISIQNSFNNLKPGKYYGEAMVALLLNADTLNLILVKLQARKTSPTVGVCVGSRVFPSPKVFQLHLSRI